MKVPKRKPFDLYTLPYRWKKKPSEYDIYPGFNRRMTAVTLDSIVMLFFQPLFDWLAPVNTSTIGNTLPPTDGSSQASGMLLQMLSNPEFITSWVQNFMLQTLGFFIYCAICWYFWSATPGKIIMRMKIVDASTQGRMSPLQIFLRLFGYLISCFTFMLGIFWIGFNKRHRGWHDYLASTVVITVAWNFKYPFSKYTSTPIQEPTPNETTAD